MSFLSNKQSDRISYLAKNPRFIFGISVIGALIFMATFAPYISPYNLEQSDFMDRMCPPSPEHWLGCDVNGNDILTVMIYGARSSIYVGFLTVLLSLLLGVSIGLASGYYRGIIDMTLMRIVDVFMAFPGILMAMAISSLLGPSLNTVILAIAATGWTSAARIVRGQVLSIREKEHVLAAKAIGVPNINIMIKHIFPLTLSPLLVHATFSLSGVIIVEAGLSFLGLGAQGTNIVTWGGLLGQGSEIQLDQAPYITIVPGLAIFTLVMGLNLLGDALRDTFDEKANY
jgi:peptide/nickel transport system permease protein